LLLGCLFGGGFRLGLFRLGWLLGLLGGGLGLGLLLDRLGLSLLLGRLGIGLLGVGLLVGLLWLILLLGDSGWCLLSGLALTSQLLEKLVHLGVDLLLAASTSLLVLGATSLGLIVQHLAALNFGLTLVDLLHENTLVLVHVTLALEVELTVQMSVDFFGFTVFLEQASENAHTSHPEDLLWHSGVCCTLSLTVTTMTTLTTCLGIFACARLGVNSHWLFDDQAIGDEFSNVLS